MPSFASIRPFLIPEAVPLLVPVSFAVGIGIYTGIRALTTAPDVLVNKDMRRDQMAENPLFMQRAEKYEHSVFRTAAHTREKPHILPNEYMARSM